MDHSGRILFVDDDAPVRTAFARSLKSHGFEIDLADGFERAAELLEDREYAVIATDYRMPRVNGLELIQELRDQQPDTTFVLVSGECDLELALEAVNGHSVSHVICKPWDTEELAEILRRSVETHWERAGQRQVQMNMVATSKRLDEQRKKLLEATSATELNIAEMLLNAMDLRGHENRSHCRRVADYALLLAKEMGIRGHALLSIEQGALLHDVGKIGIPDSILFKPAALSEEEWTTMRSHPELGGKLLDGFETLSDTREIIRQHHERWDGTGYPMGLSGEQIVIGARIFAVVDAFEAIICARPYREARTIEMAIDEIVSCAGTQFDPTVVMAFAKISQKQWEVIALPQLDNSAA